jgi:hypothetical protein
MGRSVAIVVALAVGIGGVLPRWTAYRCTMMETVTAHPCCPKDEAPNQTLRDASCCVAFQAPELGTRISPRATQPRIDPAPLAGCIALPSLMALPASALALRLADSAPPPRPRTLLLTTVLRI